MAGGNPTTSEETDEVWLPIPGYEGVYSVSNIGRVVRDAPPLRNRVLQPEIDKDGYFRLSLYRDGQPRHWHVHVLVALAFIGVRPEGHEVNHIDGIKVNNQPENLEYVTSKGNSVHAANLGLLASGIRSGQYTQPLTTPRGERHVKAKLTTSDVEKIRSLLAEGVSRNVIAKQYGVTRACIANIKKGRSWVDWASSKQRKYNDDGTPRKRQSEKR